MSAVIEVSDRRNGKFQVMCISTGGRPTTMSVAGPYASVQHQKDNVVEKWSMEGVGNDSLQTNFHQKGGRNGDLYTCTASNHVSNSSSSVTLKGMQILCYSL